MYPEIGLTYFSLQAEFTFVNPPIYIFCPFSTCQDLYSRFVKKTCTRSRTRDFVDNYGTQASRLRFSEFLFVRFRRRDACGPCTFRCFFLFLLMQNYVWISRTPITFGKSHAPECKPESMSEVKISMSCKAKKS